MCSSDFNHIDIRSNIRQKPLHMGQSSRQHRQTMRHLDLIVFHDIHKICHNCRHIDFAHIHIAVFHKQAFDVFIELSLVRLFLELANGNYCLQDQTHVIQGNPLYRLSDHLPVMLSQPSHHSHVDPDDLPVAYLHIAGMRIRMEESIVHDLLNIVVNQLAADLL